MRYDPLTTKNITYTSTTLLASLLSVREDL